MHQSVNQLNKQPNNFHKGGTVRAIGQILSISPTQQQQSGILVSLKQSIPSENKRMKDLTMSIDPCYILDKAVLSPIFLSK